MFIRNWLEIDYLKGLDLDDPRTSELRRRAIMENAFLHQIYQYWYQLITASIPSGSGQILELGSGAGFLQDYIPNLITSEILFLNGMRLQLDGQALPFASNSLKAIAMTNVLHHIPAARLFFQEGARVLKSGGVISMLEPWNSAWSKFIYTRLHHEPFNPQAAHWEFPSSGPLSGANGAIPWIIFERDKHIFENEFPLFQIQAVQLLMPFVYLLSGGVSMRPLLPGWSYAGIHAFENLCKPFLPYTALFAHIVLKKK